MSGFLLMSFVSLTLLAITFAIPPPEGHPGYHDHHADGSPVDLSPEEEAKMQDMQQRFASVMNTVCKPDTIPEEQLQQLDACHTKGPAKDSPAILACEEQIFGKKSLDQRRKDMCNDAPENRRRKGHLMRDCIMKDPEIQAKIAKLKEEHQKKTDGDRKKFFMEKRATVLVCLEKAVEEIKKKLKL